MSPLSSVICQVTVRQKSCYVLFYAVNPVRSLCLPVLFPPSKNLVHCCVGYATFSHMTVSSPGTTIGVFDERTCPPELFRNTRTVVRHNFSAFTVLKLLQFSFRRRQLHSFLFSIFSSLICWGNGLYHHIMLSCLGHVCHVSVFGIISIFPKNS